jgi:type IV secretory pathway VirB10-like protein
MTAEDSMHPADPMSPNASPGEAPKKSGVRRVNNLPVYIIGALMAVFLIVMMLVASDRAAQQHRKAPAKDDKSASASMFANAIVGTRKDGFIPPEKAMPPAMPAIPIARPDDLDAPPTPPGGASSQGAQGEQRGNDELARIRMVKLQQLEEAIKARTNVQVAAPRSAGSPPGGLPENGQPATREEALVRLAAIRQQIDAQTRDNPTAAYQARLLQLQAVGMVAGDEGGVAMAPGSSSSPAAVTTHGRAGKDYGQFKTSSQEDRWKLSSQPEAPRSPYELRAGFVVPAALISGINSDLPGQIMAQVSQDVFDTATGKWKLIPQGARLVGQYSSDVAYGQSRVLIAWQRIVFPDGKAMDIGAMPGADSAGYAGFKDQVNNHYLRLFASAFLMSGVTAGISMSQPQTLNTNTRQSASSAISEALGQQLGQVTAQLIARNMNIAPTLEIRPGYRFNVIVTKDMTFSKPYRAFDY